MAARLCRLIRLAQAIPVWAIIVFLTTQPAIIAEFNNNMMMCTVLNGGALITKGSVRFQYVNKDGNNVYYVTLNAFAKLKRAMKVEIVSHIDN